MSKTTLDLSTLSDISDGTHTVKVKAKADGYRDSEFSNEVSYKKSSGYSGTITNLSNSTLPVMIFDINDERVGYTSVGEAVNVSGNYFKMTATRTDATLRIALISGATHSEINSYSSEVTITSNNFRVEVECTF